MANFNPAKTWSTNEKLTAIDLNAEFANIINNVTAGNINSANIDETDAYTWTGAHVFNGTVVFNELGADVDYRLEGLSNTNLTVWDAGQDAVSFGGANVDGAAFILNNLQQRTNVTSVGSQAHIPAQTTNFDNASGTVAIGSAMFIGIPTWTNANSTLTMTHAASLYIQGVPVDSTNVTATNTPYAIWVDAGEVRLDGLTTIGGILSVDDTTDSTSTTTGSIHTDGGLGLAKDLFVGNDILIATGGVTNWAGGDVTLTHAAGKLTFGGDGAVEIDFNNHEMTNVDINSGAIDGTTIGAASVAAGSFAAVVGTTINASGKVTVTSTNGIEIDVASGDPRIVFDTGSADKFCIGVDDSDSDYFKISKGGTIGGTSGDYHFYDGWGLAIIAPEGSSARLYLAADDADDVSDAYRLEVGTAGEFVIDARTVQVGAMPDNGGTWTERLRIDSSGNVGLGTTSLDEKMNIAGNIELDVATGDPSIIFDTQGANKFSIGVDDSDGDSFKISEGGAVGAGGALQDIVVFPDSSGLAIVAGEASSARFFLAGDNADDAIDVWRLDGGSAGLKFQHRTATVGALPDNSGTYASRLVLDGLGSVHIGTAALATNATDGFLYISSMAGAPSGTPTDHSNLSAIVHDTTNNRIYLYDHVSNAWAFAALT
jgi:hypothetical protein